MKRIRPITPHDLPALLEMATTSSGGISSLPPDRDWLRQKIEASQSAFSSTPQTPGDASYLFVLEETQNQQAVGCCGIHAKAGGAHPLYVYQPETMTVSSAQLGISNRIEVLQLHQITDGPSEVCTLFLMPRHRRGGLGYLLSLSRFLFMALHPHRFQPRVLVSLRGVLTERGESPFWEAVCRPFFGLDFPSANRYRYKDPTFIADLAPPFPLCPLLLPQRIREILGKTHRNTRGARRMLTGEGFTLNGHIDPLDGGPFLDADQCEIRTAKLRQTGQLARIHPNRNQGHNYLICNHRLAFRSCLGSLTVDPNGEIALGQSTAEALQVEVGDPVSAVPLPRESSR